MRDGIPIRKPDIDTAQRPAQLFPLRRQMPVFERVERDCQIRREHGRALTVGQIEGLASIGIQPAWQIDRHDARAQRCNLPEERRKIR